MPTTATLRCPYCDKECSSKSGLTNHKKNCTKIPRGNGRKPGGGITYTEVVSDPRDIDPRDIDPRGGVERPRPQMQTNNNGSKPKAKPGGDFDIGAFLILGDHIPLLLDLNFAAALSDHIMHHGSENRAIMAFGHQLKKAAGD